MIRYDGEDVMPGMKLSHNADIHELIFDNFTEYENGDKLPDVWITNAVYDSNNRYLGHTYMMPYEAALDPDGADALFYGGGLYDDGMRLSDPEFAGARLDCFKTAELLYRHAAGKGNPVAYLCLGYVYYYDRCKGEYWVNLDQLKTDEDYRRPYPREERAFECFKLGSYAGISEASYKLGDCYKNGIGCDINERRAFHCYQEAASFDEGGAAYLTGSIALRLAGCYEEGVGCEHDFKRALEQYEAAERFLDVAVVSGDSYYEGALRNAHDGAIRCRQEISLME